MNDFNGTVTVGINRLLLQNAFSVSSLQCALAAAQYIVIGPVCGCVCVCVCEWVYVALLLR